MSHSLAFLPAAFTALLICLLSGQMLLAQSRPAYRIFDAKGEELDYQAMEDSALRAEAVFFGEMHNNPIAHWLQLELAEGMARRLGASRLCFGAEMFETDQQAALDAYLGGRTPRADFERETELWPNYATDYRPLVRLAEAQQIPLFATNAPRRHARLTARSGPQALAELPAAEQQWLPPLPFPIEYGLPSYQRMRQMLGGGHGGSMNPDHFIAAQALKDATMAWTIATRRPAGRVLLHLNGSYHSDHREGIIWYLERYAPGIRIMSISVAEQDDITRPDPEQLGKADFLILTPRNMTKTYLSDPE